jgi:iron complex outermembrane receptor protein
MQTSIRQKSLPSAGSVWSSASIAAMIVALASAAPALAQAAGEAGQPPQLEDIVVTAQKRSENVDRVPITISAMSSDMLQARGITDTASLSATVPGLQLNRSFRGGTPFIRGIGNPSGAVGDEGAVAFYIDGVYQTNLIAQLFEFNNIERVEVLKGPQGTLFGRNALGGVIQVITRDPGDTPQMDVGLGYANYGTVKGSLYASSKIADGLAADLAVQGFKQHNGWGKNLVTGNDVYKSSDISLRSKWVWRPGSGTKITLAGQYSHNTDFSTSSHLDSFGLAGFVNPGRYNVQLPRDPIADVETYGGSIKFEQDLDWARLVNITAYGYTKFRQLSDLDSQPLNLVQLDLNGYDRAWNNELQLLSSADSKISWVLGFFYLNDRTGYKRPVGWFQTGGNIPGGFFNRFGNQATDSYAGYAQATVPLRETTRLTAGIRYTSEKRGLVFTQVPIAPRYPVDTSVKFSKFSYRIALDHQLSDDAMVYASYTTGFKSGLYNTNAPLDPPVSPETVGAFEAGFKSKWFDRRFSFDASVFHYDFNDIQLRKPTGAAGGTTSLLNAAAGRSMGLDVSMQALPTSRLSLQAGFEILRTKFTSFPNAPISFLAPASCVAPAGSTGAPTGGTVTCVGDATGNKLLQSPPFSAFAAAQYRIPTSSGDFHLGLQYSYKARFFWEADNRLDNRAHSLVNANLNWTSPGGEVELGLWVKNLADTRYSVNKGSLPFGDITTDAPPRTYGVDVKFHIGS